MLLLLLLAGAASALALPPLGLVAVLLLALPLLLRAVGDATSMAQAALRGFVFGFGFYCAGLYWITDAILIRADQFWWAVPFATPLCAIPLAVFIAVPAAACRLAPAGWRRIILFAGLWTLSDLAREFVFTGFPWNPLGSAWEWSGQLSTIMIQPAAWIGVPGLTLATVSAACLPMLGRRGVFGLLLLLALWGGAGAARLAWVAPLSTRNPVVVLVQGNVPEREKFDRADAVASFRRYLRLTAEGTRRARAMPQEAIRGIAVAWPESAFPGLLAEDAPARSMIMAASAGADAALIGSVRYGNDGRPRNSLVALLPGGAVAAIYDKVHLVPFGEYQPPGLPFQLVPGGGFEAGPGRATLHLPGLAPVDPLICYEIIFPGQVVYAADRPTWILNVTNDAWYGDSAGPRQHLAAARMRAVEEGLPVARAANTGISAAYDGFGRELGRLGWGRAGSLVVALPPPLRATWFARVGLLMPLLLALAACAAACVPAASINRPGRLRFSSLTRVR
ncbi:apolipoprotein N-acyltransferase [Lichenicoccus sp.]|uniref:apolipoprotein N-acyltransferase n=1 Tax=Lichenicoccus sp. TaxID=2781899 RepID=UPI003D0F5F2B